MEKAKKLKKKFKITKKKIILLIIVVLIGGTFIKNKLNPPKDTEKKIEVVEVTKRDIAKSISDTGVVKTNTSKEFTSPLSGTKILTVNVKEGDQVNPGDVICTFDTTDIERNLNTAVKSAGITDAQAKIGINGAARNYNDAINNKDSQNKTSQADVDAAKKAFDDSTDALNGLRQSVANLEPQANDAKAKAAGLQKAFSDAQAAYEFAQKNVGTAQGTSGEAGQGDGSADAGSGAGTNTGVSAQELADLYSKFISAKEAYEANAAIISQYDSLVAQKAEMEKSSSQLLSAYQKTVDGMGTSSRTADSTVASSYDALLNSELSRQSSSVTAQSQIDSLRKQLKDGKLISDVSGTITKVNVKPGDLYAGTTIAILDGCEDIVIEASVGEYDIPDVRTGMKVMVKTDATRDEELEGRITYVSPVATNMMTSSSVAGATTSSGSASFPIKISLDKANERLRLGMNAKLSIVTEMKNDVWSVPYECIITKDDGTTYIEVADNDDGTEKHELQVQKGIEGTYYVEIISNELKEGMKVVVPEMKTDNSLESLLNSMGPSAGI